MSGSVLVEPSWPEKLRKLNELTPLLRRMALEKQRDAVHWRNPPTLVGCVGLAWSPLGYKRLTGSNFKTAGGTEGPRCCAEEEVEGRAFLEGCTEMIAIVSAATYQTDDATGQDMHGTLPPCIYCRRRWLMKARDEKDHSLMKPHTRFISQRVEVIMGSNHPPIVSKVARFNLKELFEKFPTELP